MSARAARGTSALAWAALAWALTAGVALAQVEAEFADEFDTEYEEAPEVEAEVEADTAAEFEAPPTEGEAGEPLTDTRRDQLFRAQNSWYGPVGGLHAVDASAGLPGTFRLQLGIDFFSDTEWLAPGDANNYVGGTLSFGWTVIDHLELYGSVANHANSNNMERPALLQVLGDTMIGGKAFAPVGDVVGLGGDLRFVVLNTVGDIGPVLGGTSVGLRGLVSMDLRQLEEPVPILGRFNIGYFFDNSSHLIEDVEAARYERLQNPREPENEDRHLVRRIERFALGINRTDFFEITLGFEAPLQAAQDFFIHPLLEWELRIPVNRQDYSCLDVGSGGTISEPDGCLDILGFSAMPQTLTLGARVLPPVRGLSFALGVDIGLSGVTTFVRELAPNKPHDFLLAVAYTVDTKPPPAAGPPVEVVREVVKEPPPGPRVEGVVAEVGLGNPVVGAIVRYPGTDLTAQATDEQGRFVSYELPPGEARFDVSHPDYEPNSCFVTIPAPGTGAAAAPAGAQPMQGPGAGAAAGGEARGQLTLTPLPESEVFAGGPGGAPPPPTPPGAAPEAGPGADAAAGKDAYEPLMVPLRCELTPKPRNSPLQGTVVDENGQPVAGATIELTGPSSQTLTSDASGSFTLPEIPAGAYTARVDAEAYFIKMDGFSAEPGKPATPRIVLTAKPKKAAVQLTQREVRIKKKIFFKTNSAEISEKSHELLSEVADVLMRNPQVQHVEVQGHTDNRGSPDLNRTLSQQRADSVRQWLIGAGVEGDRLTAKGYGDTRPIVPNLTERNRARNRRVQFIIRDRQEPAADPEPAAE